MAELVDALDSKSSDSNVVRVRFPPSVQMIAGGCFYSSLFYFSGSMIFSVYILQSTVKNYIYVGITDNIDRRLFQHNHGLNPTTKPYTPFLLIHSEHFETRQAAREKEKYFKTSAGKRFIRKYYLKIQ